MTIADEIKRHVESFIKRPPQEIIIWGAGETAERCFEWLQLYGLENIVKGFVDTRKSKIGTLLFNLPVRTPDYLEQESGVAVIIASLWKHMFYNEIPNKLNRQIYYFKGDYIPYYNDETHDIPIADLYSVYRDDRITRDYIDISLMLRGLNFERGVASHTLMNCGGVIPYTMIDYIRDFCEYWDSSELSLLPFKRVTLVDGGAYTGDSVERLVNVYRDKIVRIYAFEPDESNFAQLTETIKGLGISNMSQAFCMGLSTERGREKISTNEDMSSNFMITSSDCAEAEVTSLDDTIQHVDGKLCIKLDIEGYELMALRGASKLIKKYKPELSICVYHKYSDIIEIPMYIKSLVPEYNCILRGEGHLECYASVDRF